MDTNWKLCKCCTKKYRVYCFGDIGDSPLMLQAFDGDVSRQHKIERLRDAMGDNDKGMTDADVLEAWVFVGEIDEYCMTREELPSTEV